VSVPRFTSDALPAYSFVPGQSPHPHTDPAGHHFGRELPPAEPLEPERWQTSHRYLLGIDLFNHGYYWEAHEAWEAVWNAQGRRGTVATFLKCLIQLAVVGVKVRQGMRDAAIAHARRAAELAHLVRSAIEQPRFLGLDVAEVEQWALRLVVSPPAYAASESVAPIFPFPLGPVT
jgi:hypothetical protein